MPLIFDVAHSNARAWHPVLSKIFTGWTTPTRARDASSMQHGTRKRGRFDSLAPVDAKTWLVVNNKHSEAIEITVLPPRADLRAILTAERERRRADGWDVDDIPTLCAFFFCARDGVRVYIGIERRDPTDDRRGVP